MRTVILLLCVLATACVSGHNGSVFRRQFDHFYPDDPRYGDKLYRDRYVKLLSAPMNYGDLGAASAGDRAALRRFLSRASAEADQLDGGRGETYTSDLRFLLIRIGDHSFAEALRQLTHKQREAVAARLDCMISYERGWFPETTSTYEYRYRRTPSA